MSAQIIWLSRAENIESASRPCPPPRPAFRASLARAGRPWWHRARLTTEGLGWIVVAASVIAAIKG